MRMKNNYFDVFSKIYCSDLLLCSKSLVNFISGLQKRIAEFDMFEYYDGKINLKL